jgi:hypothetical protein
VKDCNNPPTKTLEIDAGLEGGMSLYFCEEHEGAYRRGDRLDLEVDRSEPEGASAPES